MDQFTHLSHRRPGSAAGLALSGVRCSVTICWFYHYTSKKQKKGEPYNIVKSALKHRRKHSLPPEPS